MKKLKETIKNIMKEESEYQTFFKKALEKSGKSIPQMSDEEKKAFFNKIDAAWDGKGEKNEELVGNQHKLDIDGDGEIEASDLAALRAGKKKEESVNEDYDGPAILKLGDKNLLKVGEKITINTDGKKKEYKVVKSNGNGDFVLHIVKESVNEAKTYSNKFVSWFTGTVLNTVKHPKYGKHQLTPEQIASSPGEYKDKLFKAIEKAVKNGDITPDMIKKNESVNEGIGTIALGVAGGLLLLKVLKFVVKKVLGAIGTNVPLPKEKLHKITDELFEKVLVTGGKIDMMNVKALRSVIKEMIDKGQITTLSQITKVIEKASKEEPKNESVNEVTHTFTSGQWVAWHNTPKGKKYYNTFKSGKAAQDWALKNNGGAMPKKDWDEKEAKYAVESVNEEMDTITKEKWAKTHKDYKMMRNGVPHILKMVNGATTLVPVKIVKETQTVSENFSSSDVEKIKGAVEGASSFMGIGAQLKKLGMKYDFSTSPLPVYMIKKGAKTFVLVNKKYAEDPQFVVGDTAGGLLEGKINEGKDVKASTVKAGDKISLSDKYNPSGINTPFTVKSIEKKDGYITFKGDSPKNVLKVKETSPVALHESKINEGNAFGAAVTKAKKEGLKEFEFNGKKYKVKKGSYEKNESAKKLAEKSEVVTKK
jgi:hypothetical protein